jgi:hypothetical protein
VIKNLEKAAAPFDNIDLILTTSSRSGHCNPILIASHLALMPDAVFVSTARITDDVWSLLPFSPEKPPRLKTAEPKEGDMTPVAVEGLNLVVLNLPAEGGVGNLGFVIRLEGWTLLHPGASTGGPGLAAYNPSNCDVDVAFIPLSLLAGGEEPAKAGRCPMVETIKAAHIVPMGFSSKALSKDLRKTLTANYPESILFYKSMDSCYMIRNKGTTSIIEAK